MRYAVWQGTTHGWTLNPKHVYRRRWRALLRAFLIRVSNPSDSRFGDTKIEQTTR